MDTAYRTSTALALPQLRVERVVQDRSGPFTRCHLLDAPSLVYLPGGGEPALGCFGPERPQRGFTRFGRVVVVPANIPLHVRSFGCDTREMLIVRFGEAQFAAITGLDPAPTPDLLAACVDVSATNIATTMERVAAELDRPQHGGATILEGLGLVLLGELARHFDRVRDRRAGKDALAGWQVARIEARLGDATQPLPDIAELATLCGISARHLMRSWKAVSGETVMARIDRQRFDRARDLLREGGAPVKAIAARCGFASPSAFTAAFRRRFGATPRGWRA